MPTAARHASRERLRGITSMIAAVVVFAIMDASLKRLSTQYGLFQVSCLRCLSSLLFLCLPVLWRGSWQTLRAKSPRLHLLRAVLGIAMLGSFVLAVRSLTLAETYAVFLCAPLLMTALSVPIHGEDVPLRRWVAIVVGLAGVIVSLRPTRSHALSMTAMAAAAVGALSYALAALTVRTMGRNNSNTAMVFWFLVLAGAGTGILSLGDWHPVPRGDWVWLCVIGITGALGQFWLTDAFRRAPPSVVGPFEYTSILWAFAIDWVFWGAKPTVTLLLGSAIVIASGVFVIWDERRLAQLAMNPSSPPP